MGGSLIIGDILDVVKRCIKEKNGKSFLNVVLYSLCNMRKTPQTSHLKKKLDSFKSGSVHNFLQIKKSEQCLDLGAWVVQDKMAVRI